MEFSAQSDAIGRWVSTVARSAIAGPYGRAVPLHASAAQ